MFDNYYRPPCGTETSSSLYGVVTYRHHDFCNFFYVFEILSCMSIRSNWHSNRRIFKSRCEQITRIVAVMLNDIKRNENGVDDTFDSIYVFYVEDIEVVLKEGML